MYSLALQMKLFEMFWSLVVNESSKYSVISAAEKDITEGTCCYVMNICNNHI